MKALKLIACLAAVLLLASDAEAFGRRGGGGRRGGNCANGSCSSSQSYQSSYSYQSNSGYVAPTPGVVVAPVGATVKCEKCGTECICPKCHCPATVSPAIVPPARPPEALPPKVGANADLDELNAVRAQLGLVLLVLDPDLCAGAQNSANIQASNHWLGHPPGWSNSGAMAEIAAPAGTMREAISLWSQSRGHWGHIVSRSHTRVGIGLAGGYATCQFR